MCCFKIKNTIVECKAQRNCEGVFSLRIEILIAASAILLIRFKIISILLNLSLVLRMASVCIEGIFICN